MANGRLYQLSHCTYLCTYHVVWTPKYRGRVLADNFIKQELRRILKQICHWKGFVIEGWHIGDEHIHLVVVIPPKYSVAYAIAIIKGKSSAWIKKKTKKFPQGTLWNRGYFVSTIGMNVHQVKNYVKNQSHHQRELEQQKLSL
jgi:putative transposase